MKFRVQMAIYILTALAILDVCSVNLISRASPLKMPQTMSSAGPARCSNAHTIRPHDHVDSQRRVLAATPVGARTLQIP
jgi:hypothetical protein